MDSPGSPVLKNEWAGKMKAMDTLTRCCVETRRIYGVKEQVELNLEFLFPRSGRALKLKGDRLKSDQILWGNPPVHMHAIMSHL